MKIEWTGGQPRTTRQAVDGTGALVPFQGDSRAYGGGTTKWLILRNLSVTATEIIRVYWTKEDFDGDKNYVTLDINEEISAPIEMAVGVYAKSQAGTPTLEVTALYRRA